MEINKRNRTELKSYFVKNAIPTESNFADLIEGVLNQKEDGIVKLPGNPLSIEASGDDASLKKAINFYRNFNDANPDWTINLNPRDDPNNAGTSKLGLNISDGDGKSRLFIDRATGNVGVGTVGPGAKLQVADGAIMPAAGNAETAGIMFAKAQGGGAGDAAWIRYYARQGNQTTFEIGTSNDPRDHIALMPSGNVGIGTPNPAAKLQVSGGAIMPTAGNGESAGIMFAKDPGGGAGDAAWIRYYPRSGEATTLEIGTSNDKDDHIALITAGNVGIKTTNPEKDLHLERGELRVRASHNNTTADIGAFYAENLSQGVGIGYNRIEAIGSNAQQNIHIIAKANGSVVLQNGGDRSLHMQSDGNLVIYTSRGQAVWASGTNVSDVRLKKEIRSIDHALDTVLQLRGVSFSWKDKKLGAGQDIGMVAQEVESVAPCLVHSVDKKTKMLRYEKCVPLLIEAIKEQQAQIGQLRREIDLLRA